jgi:aspartate racemase
MTITSETSITQPKNASPLIGVIGGVGPYAGLGFLENIFQSTLAERDQDHVSCMLISCPSLIPDRTAFLLDEGARDNPAAGMFLCARSLYQAGARYASVACNTAHAGRIFSPFQELVKEHLPDLTLVNMLKVSAAFVKDECQYRKLGLLATLGTYKSAVFHEYFKDEDGFTLIEPEERGQAHIMEAIYGEAYGIKLHSHPVKALARNAILYEIYRLADRGADAVILGCTELPLAVDQNDLPIPSINPALLTARALVKLAAPDRLLPF